MTGENQEKNFLAAGGSGVDHQVPPPPYYQYGTFQGVAYYSQPSPPAFQPVNPPAGFPHPALLPSGSAAPSRPYHYVHGYHTVPGYAVAEGRPYREPCLPCCGIGIGWLLFVAGFFFAAVPWYIGAFILLCVGVDYREKPGLVACLVAAILVLIAITLGATQGVDRIYHHNLSVQ